VPAIPYRGIQPFRYEDHAIFFAREIEARVLASLVTAYRGVFLYGDSGNGKSSLVNAGLLPQTNELGLQPLRVRVQPRSGEELVVEQMAAGDEDPLVGFAPPSAGSSSIVLSVAEFEERVRAATQKQRPLVIFDQFEEVLTLFEGDEAVQSRRALTAMIGRLLRDPIPVKLLFAFREDYLGRVKQLLDGHPELVDQALRLGPPKATDLERIIRGPFDRNPGHFERELDVALARRLTTQLEERFGTGDVSLSEVQTVCLRLWNSTDPDRLLTDRGVQGLLEDELGEALGAFSPDLRAAAIAVLSQMVTSSGTRNVISAEDLRLRVHEEDEQVSPERFDEALARLESDAHLIGRERRRDIDLFEIRSEFLVPWIRERREEARLVKERARDELRREQERARDRRRLRIFGSIAGAMLVVAAIVVVFAISAVKARDDAEARTIDANSLALAGSSSEPLATRPDISLGLAFEAYRLRQRPEAGAAVRQALLAARSSGLRGVLDGDGGRLLDTAVSPDGTIIAAASDSGKVLLWNATARTKIAELDGHGETVWAVAFSPDGKLLASGGKDGTVRIWNLAKRAQLTHMSANVHKIYAVAFSPDGKSLAVAGYDGVSLGNATGRTKLHLLAGDTTLANDVAFSPDGRSLVSAGAKGLTLWNPAKPDLRGKVLDERGAVNDAAFSADGKTIAVATHSGVIRVWDMARKTQIGHDLKGHTGPVAGVAFSPDNKTVASSGDDGTVRLWNPASGTELARLSGHIGAVSSVAFSPDGKLLVSAGDVDTTVRLWNPATRAERGRLEGHQGELLNVEFSSDGKTLAATGNGISLWNPAIPARRHSLGSSRSDIGRSAFAPSGKVIAAADLGDGTIRLWDPAKRTQIGSLTSDSTGYVMIAYSRDGKIVAAADFDGGTVRFWKPPSRRPTGHLRFGDEVYSLAFSPDGRTLAVAGSADQGAGLYDVVSRKRRGSLTGHTNWIQELEYSPDGTIIATASDDYTIRLWNASTGKTVRVLTGHTAPVYEVAFSPDGRILASASEDRTVRLWDSANGSRLGRLSDRSQKMNAVAFSSDGKTLASAAADGSVRLWSEILWRDLRELHATVCNALLTGISRSDWRQYAGDIPYRQSCP